MVELMDPAVEAAWKIRNLDDYDRRLERAAHWVDDVSREHDTAALVIYEVALMRSGRPLEEVRDLVRRFKETYTDDEEALTIPRVSGILNVEGVEWFFGDESLRLLTGRLLGQFQHRVAQYNYVSEREVLKRWADSYDTRLFIRRGIYETEPVVGVVGGFDLPLVQHLRVMAGGDTLVPSADVSRALESLGFAASTDEYEILARAEGLALQLDLPAPVAGAMLADLFRDGVTDFPEPPRETTGDVGEGAGADEAEGGEDQGPSPEDQTARRTARNDPGKGEEPTRIQDPQSKDTPGVPQETPGAKQPSAPESGRNDAPGASEDARGEEQREE